jgi:hypothetical protein
MKVYLILLLFELYYTVEGLLKIITVHVELLQCQPTRTVIILSRTSLVSYNKNSNNLK